MTGTDKFGLQEHCRCGKKLLFNGEPAVFNGYQHEPFSKPDGFCGPSHLHELRDTRALLKEALEIVKAGPDLHDLPSTDSVEHSPNCWGCKRLDLLLLTEYLNLG